jgi:hypothetical protein
MVCWVRQDRVVFNMAMELARSISSGSGGALSMEGCQDLFFQVEDKLRKEMPDKLLKRKSEDLTRHKTLDKFKCAVSQVTAEVSSAMSQVTAEVSRAGRFSASDAERPPRPSGTLEIEPQTLETRQHEIEELRKRVRQLETLLNVEPGKALDEMVASRSKFEEDVREGMRTMGEMLRHVLPPGEAPLSSMTSSASFRRDPLRTSSGTRERPHTDDGVTSDDDASIASNGSRGLTRGRTRVRVLRVRKKSSLSLDDEARSFDDPLGLQARS